MAIHDLEPGPTIARIESEIAQQQVTIRDLKQSGHETTDAEKHLRDMRESLALLR
jgi:hypothetical protein